MVLSSKTLLVFIVVAYANCSITRINVKYYKLSNGTRVDVTDRSINALANLTPESTFEPSPDADDSITPDTKSVLIQAPKRKIKCEGQQKVAKGRCRDIW